MRVLNVIVWLVLMAAGTLVAALFVLGCLFMFGGRFLC